MVNKTQHKALPCRNNKQTALLAETVDLNWNHSFHSQGHEPSDQHAEQMKTLVFAACYKNSRLAISKYLEIAVISQILLAQKGNTMYDCC